MPPDRSLLDTTAGASPQDTDVQQLIEAESGRGTQGILRRWLASNSAATVLTSDSTGVKISRDAGATPPSQVVVDGTPAGGNLAGTYPNPTLSTAIMDLLVPPGTVISYAAPGVPAGWLHCNGTVVSRATYPRLFAAIGTTYNTGGEAGTDFRLPDLLGRVVLGLSGTHALATAGGTETGAVHTHTGSHSHGLNSHTHGPGLHTHDLNGHAHTLSSHTHGPGLHTHGLNGHTHGPGSHTHDLNHDHANALGAAAASTSTLNGRFTAGGVSALPDAHTHDVNLPALGIVPSGVPSASDTGGPTTTTVTLGPSAAATDAPSPSNTGTNSGNTSTPSTDATAAATGSTADDNTAPAAAYPGASANLPPFLSLTYLIRTG